MLDNETQINEDNSLHINVGPGIPAEVEAQPSDFTEMLGRVQEEPAPQIEDDNRARSLLKLGMTREETATQISQEQNINADEADLTIVDSIKEMITDTRASGHSDETIRSYFSENTQYEAKLVEDAFETLKTSTKTDKLDYKPKVYRESVGKAAQELADVYSNTYEKQSTTFKSIAGFFNEDMAVSARADIDELNLGIVEKLKENAIDAFIDPTYGHIMIREGKQEFELDSSFIDSMALMTGEFAGGITGAIAGGRMGMAVSAAIPVPGARVIGTAGGAIIGGMVGTGAGKGLDLLRNSFILSEELSTELYKKQMVDAGLIDGISGIVGGTILAGVLKGAYKSYRFFRSGNIKGAYEALKKNTQLDDKKIDEIIKMFETVHGKEALEGLSREEKAIKTIALTHARAQTPVRAAVAKDPEISTNLAASLHGRTLAIKRTLGKYGDPNIGQHLREELQVYEKEVKKLYTTVKDNGIAAMQETDFSFDLPKTAIRPVLDKIRSGIRDTSVLEKFVRYADHIGSTSQVRTFEGLLDLRAAVNEFKYGFKLTGPDLKAINTVITKIDSMVDTGITKHIGEKEGKKWIGNFKVAKKAYSEMKKLQDNTLHASITNVNATEKSIKQALLNWSKDNILDSKKYNEVISKLGSKNKTKLEAALINTVTERHTIGKGTESQVIDFIKLDEELRGLNLLTPQGKYARDNIAEQAKLFRNNRALASVTGHMVTDSGGVMITSLEGRAKLSFWRTVFESTAKLIPWNDKASQIALIHHTGRLLRNPMNVKGVKELLRAVPKQAKEEVAESIKTLQMQIAKEGVKVKDTYTPMYKATKTGKLVVTEGKLGQGIYVSDSLKTTTEGMKKATHDVDLNRLANVDTISNLLGREVTLDEVKKLPNLKEQLIKRGYLGIKFEDKAMLFPETTMGVKTPKKLKPIKPDTGQLDLMFGGPEEVIKRADPSFYPNDTIDIILKEAQEKLPTNRSKRVIDRINKRAKNLGYKIEAKFDKTTGTVGPYKAIKLKDKK